MVSIFFKAIIGLGIQPTTCNGCGKPLFDGDIVYFVLEVAIRGFRIADVYCESCGKLRESI